MTYEEFKKIVVLDFKKTAKAEGQERIETCLKDNDDVIVNGYKYMLYSIERHECENTEAMWKSSASGVAYCLYMLC